MITINLWTLGLLSLLALGLTFYAGYRGGWSMHKAQIDIDMGHVEMDQIRLRNVHGLLALEQGHTEHLEAELAACCTLNEKLTDENATLYSLLSIAEIPADPLTQAMHKVEQYANAVPGGGTLFSDEIDNA